jgi:hypothetical protein
VPLLGPGPRLDPAYAMTTDLSEPVIIATVPVPDGGPPVRLLIDGYALPVTVRSKVAGHPEASPRSCWMTASASQVW